jgi:hypothetical protein
MKKKNPFFLGGYPVKVKIAMMSSLVVFGSIIARFY